MKKLTKKEKIEQKAEAKRYLLDYLKGGDTVYTVLNHVSASGMSRRISCYIAKIDDNGRPYIYNITYLVARVLDCRRNQHDGGLVIGGCGMDMGFHVVNSLEYAIFGIQPLSDGTKPHLRHSWL